VESLCEKCNRIRYSEREIEAALSCTANYPRPKRVLAESKLCPSFGKGIFSCLKIQVQRPRDPFARVHVHGGETASGEGGDSFRRRGDSFRGEGGSLGKGKICLRIKGGREMLDLFRVRTGNNTVALRNKIQAHHAYSVVDPT
jgi:hypothetical protein